MTSLADTLERFNRKERNLLVRDILGHSETKLVLSADFRQRLYEALKIEVSEEAWWATDYHIDWLVGALTVYTLGPAATEVAQPNPADIGLVKGNQEDGDLLIVDGQNLILVEAKAHGSWGNSQISSKVARWSSLLRHYEKLQKTGPLVSFYFVLMSPRAPQRLLPLPPDWPGNQAKLPHLELRLDTLAPAYEVTRCDGAMNSNKAGDHWRIVTGRSPTYLTGSDGSSAEISKAAVPT
jgi:hypothetical protein